MSNLDELGGLCNDAGAWKAGLCFVNLSIVTLFVNQIFVIVVGMLQTDVDLNRAGVLKTQGTVPQRDGPTL